MGHTELDMTERLRTHIRINVGRKGIGWKGMKRKQNLETTLLENQE